MVAKIGPKEASVTLKFGGGLHTRASPDDIDPREASDGQNFLLDLDNRDLRPRPPFDLIGTVPNEAEIRGGGSLLKTDGTVTTIIQAGNKVYEWDGATTFTEKATVNSSAKLRGHWRSHVWNLDDELLLTDLNLAETVKKWNGTALSSVTFTNENGSGFGNFFAKYLTISDERAIFANVKDALQATPHLMVGSLRSDYTQITVEDRPASALSEEDPFFLPSPDLKPINGLVEAFGQRIISTEKGRLFRLQGDSAKDFMFKEFYAGSGASGAEALCEIGNDIIYGRQGRVESLSDTDTFGNSEADDITANISDVVGAYTGWRIVYNSRLNRVYLFPDGQSEVWTFNTAMKSPHTTRAVVGNEFNPSGQKGVLSPWMRWKTTHSLAYQPTFVMPMLDPADGLEYTFMGDAAGNFYRKEGRGLEGDGGSGNIETRWTSRIMSMELDTHAYAFKGWIKYRKNLAFTVELVFLYGGKEVFDRTVTIAVPATEGASYYGGEAYYNGEFYYGDVSGRLYRREFVPPGQANEVQLLVRVTGINAFNISEIGLRLREAS